MHASHDVTGCKQSTMEERMIASARMHVHVSHNMHTSMLETSRKHRIYQVSRINLCEERLESVSRGKWGMENGEFFSVDLLNPRQVHA